MSCPEEDEWEEEVLERAALDDGSSKGGMSMDMGGVTDLVELEWGGGACEIGGILVVMGVLFRGGRDN